MQYFSTLPKIVQYENFTSKLLTNITARASVVPSLLNDPVVFYKYDIQDEDTPESVAQKYYGDSYAYWVILYTNEIMDPLWDWPLSNKNFNNYIENKYPSEEFNVYATIHHYEKIVTQLDVITNTTTVNKVIIDQTTYDSLVETTNTYTLPTGNVIVTITKNAVSYYDYEWQANEDKRTINLLNRIYLGQIEEEFKNLMS
jgi:hypothetical protein